MKERPIIFGGEGVRAILADAKTQSRRVVRLDTLKTHQRRHAGCWQDITPDLMALCRYGVVGDRLWVKETWAAQHDMDTLKPSEMVLSEVRMHYAATEDKGGLLWRTPLFMPRWASRLTLQIANVRVQRLQEIGEEDALAEGVRELPLQEGEPGAWWTADALSGSALHARDPIGAYRNRWDSINSKRTPWASNPWVWAISFERVS